MPSSSFPSKEIEAERAKPLPGHLSRKWQEQGFELGQSGCVLLTSMVALSLRLKCNNVSFFKVSDLKSKTKQNSANSTNGTWICKNSWRCQWTIKFPKPKRNKLSPAQRAYKERPREGRRLLDRAQWCGTREIECPLRGWVEWGGHGAGEGCWLIDLVCLRVHGCQPGSSNSVPSVPSAVLRLAWVGVTLGVWPCFGREEH